MGKLIIEYFQFVKKLLKVCGNRVCSNLNTRTFHPKSLTVLKSSLSKESKTFFVSRHLQLTPTTHNNNNSRNNNSHNNSQQFTPTKRQNGIRRSSKLPSRMRGWHQQASEHGASRSLRVLVDVFVLRS